MIPFKMAEENFNNWGIVGDGNYPDFEENHAGPCTKRTKTAAEAMMAIVDEEESDCRLNYNGSDH